MGSDFAEKVNYQRALEGELERSIQTLSEVEGARVHIVLARESLFTDREREAKASVVLRLRRLPSHESEQAIIRLVSGAVDNLNPENVTLVDTSGRVLSSPQRRGGNAVNGDLEQGLTAKLLATLEPVVGHDHVRASVNVEYDLANTEDNQETYDPNSVVALSVQKSEETSGDQRPAGIPGTTSNLPSAKTQAPAGVAAVVGASQSHRTESSTYAVNRNVRHVVQPAGGIRRISAAVLLDANSAQHSPEQLQQIASLARAALDFDA
jgi:flagellar M-ring protein FliF